MITALVALCLAGSEPIRLAPGAQEVVKVHNLTKVGVGDPNIADVTPTARGELLVTARARGRTTLTMWTSKGLETRVVVVDDGKTTELGKLVKSMVNPSLRVEEFGGQTVIDGLLDSPGELQRLRSLTANEPNVTILARLDPRVIPAVAQNINAALQRAGLKNAYASVVGSTLMLEGSVADEREMKKAQLIADSYAGDLLRR
jgi:pilus assembly protein CpaC